MAPAMQTTTSSSAQLRSSKWGSWEMRRYPKEPLVLLGKQKINLRAHPQGSGLTYLPLPLEGCSGRNHPPQQKNPSTFPRAHPSTAPGDALSTQPPGKHTLLLLLWQHYQGTPDKPSCTWGRSTKVPSLQLLRLDRTKLIILFPIHWRAQPPWTMERKRHSYLGACNFFWLFFREIPQIEHPWTEQSMVNKHGSGTLPDPQNSTSEWNSKLGATDWKGNFLIAKDFKRNTEKGERAIGNNGSRNSRITAYQDS